MGTAVEVKATHPKTEAECAVMYDFGDTISEATQLYGEDVVYNLYQSQAKIRLQAGLRICLEQGRNPDDYAKQWKPGVKAPSITADPMAAAKAAFGRMSDEEKAVFLDSLKG